MYATRRYRSYSTFRSKARGKYTGRNRRRTKYRYRRRRVARRLPFYRQAYRRRRIKRRWKQTGLTRNTTSQAFTLSADTYNNHSCNSTKPDADTLELQGANQWGWFYSPWLQFYFSNTADDVSNDDKYEGPLKGTKIVRLWQKTTIRLRPTRGPGAATASPPNVLQDIDINTEILWSVRVIWFSWKQGSFDIVGLLGGTAVEPGSIPTHIIGLGGDDEGELETGHLHVLRWNDFISDVQPATQPMANIRASYTKNHAGVYKIISDRIYRFNGLKERVLTKRFGRAIVDFNASEVAGGLPETTDPIRHRSHRYSCLLIFDVRMANPRPEGTNQVPIKMYAQMNTDFKYTLL